MLIVELDLDEFPSECQIVAASTHGYGWRLGSGLSSMGILKF